MNMNFSAALLGAASDETKHHSNKQQQKGRIPGKGDVFMKRMKKLFAILMTMAMVMGLGITGFAAGTTPSAEDTATITVTNVEKNATVTAYKIVEPTYNSNGLTGYKVVNGYSIADTKNFIPTPAEIIAIAEQVSGGGIEMTATGDGTSYSASVGAGEYIIIISGKDIYNPMVVSAAYTDANDNASLGKGTVDADSDWQLEGSTVFAKSTETVIEKTVSQPDAMVGDTVNYTITGVIPSYSDTYTNPVYSISDVLTNATYVTSGDPSTKVEPVVTIGGDSAYKDSDYTLTWNGESGFTIDFSNIATYAGKTDIERTVVITYSAVISESAVSTDPATNTATVSYGNKNSEKTDADTTYTYTFEIDDEFTKVDDKGDPLGGAIFTLYKEDGKTVVATCETEVKDGKAYIHFEGLDAGTYKLQETKAPDEYSLNNTVYTVVIEPSYGTDGTLEDYTIKIDGEEKKVEVKNTKISELPSTGGMGTTLFTIAGCVIMISAAGLFFATRKKAN